VDAPVEAQVESEIRVLNRAVSNDFGVESVTNEKGFDTRTSFEGALLGRTLGEERVKTRSASRVGGSHFP